MRPCRCASASADAGEAVPVEDGYRGGALNLAARLCSKTGPGEALASRGVLHLARSVEGITFHDAGAHEMKGLDAPVQAFLLTPDGGRPEEVARRLDAAAASDRRRRPSTVPVELDPATPLIGRDIEARRASGRRHRPEDLALRDGQR
jgi:hypothetical protein